MKQHIKNLIWVWSGFVLISFISYIIYVVQTADRRPGCSYTADLCVSSHTETSTHWQGGFGGIPGHWVTSEDEVCDEYEEVEVPCDCVTYHWFWGDYKNY